MKYFGTLIKQKYPEDKHFKSLLGALGVISCSMIIYEIVLTRIFSVLLSYHYLFAVLSIAMFGLGLGGMMLKKWLHSKQTNRPGLGYLAGQTALAVGVVNISIIVLSQHAPAGWESWIFGAILFLPMVPFLLFGATISAFFQASPGRSSWLYASDIAGGALGALATILLLDIIPAPALLFVLVITTALASFVLSRTESLEAGRGNLLVLALLIGVGGYFYAPVELMPLSNDVNKDLNLLLNGKGNKARIVDNRWSAFGQTTMVESDKVPGKRIVYIDGAAGTSMYNYRELATDTAAVWKLTGEFGEFFPFPFLKESEKDSALIIGAGAGRDVLVALFGGVDKVTAVEVNEQLIQIVKDHEGYNGGLYTRQPNVEVIADEGRHYLRQSDDKFDLIMMALPVTKSSRSLNGYALTENYLFTVEAFTDYLDHLTPEGRIIFVTHGNAELYRLLSLVLKAFEERGIDTQKAMKHIYTVARHNMPTLVIGKKAFSPEAMRLRHRVLHRLGFDKGRYFMPFQYQVSKMLPAKSDTSLKVQWNMFDRNLVDLSEGRISMADIAGTTSLNLNPVRDDNPFFYNLTRKLPFPFPQFMVFIFLGFTLLAMIIMAGRKNGEVRFNFLKPYSSQPRLKLYVVLFVSLGAAFMMLEVSLFQKMTLFIGNPASATALLLFSLLLGTGLGSLTSAFVVRLRRAIVTCVLVVMAITVFLVYGLEGGLGSAESAVLGSEAIVAVVGFFLGFPFPLLVRKMKREGLESFTYSMWGMNSIASVAGSAIAMIIGIKWGFSTAILASGWLYALVALLLILEPRRKRLSHMDEQLTDGKSA